ncbi:hypothetical protein ATKI12_8973 [Kitasatospora sp. Ki12]
MRTVDDAHAAGCAAPPGRAPVILDLDPGARERNRHLLPELLAPAGARPPDAGTAAVTAGGVAPARRRAAPQHGPVRGAIMTGTRPSASAIGLTGRLCLPRRTEAGPAPRAGWAGPYAAR